MDVYKIKLSILEAEEPFSRTIIIRKEFTLIMLEQMIKEAVGQMDGNFYVIEHGKMAIFNERCEDLFHYGMYAFYKYDGSNPNLELTIYLELLEELDQKLIDVDIIDHEWDYDFCEYCDSMKQYYEMLEILKNKKPIDLYEEYEDVVGDLENLRYEESSIRFFMQQAFRWHKGEGIG